MRAKLINEWGGAGYSMGSSIFPTNRGGQMSRGGFGGSLNLGGPNMMYTYEIKPLNRTLQPKVTFKQNIEKIKNGNIIQGEELNKKDGKKHSGVLLKTEKSNDGSIKYYSILNSSTSTIMKLDPTTCILLSGNVEINVPRLSPAGGDEEDARRADQNQKGTLEYSEGRPNNESMRAKTINESMTKPVETTVDEFMTWYTNDPEWMDDWQTTNVMEVNGEHAQHDDQNGMSWLGKLNKLKYEPITIKQHRFRLGDWDLSFTLDGDEYSLQSGVSAFTDEDDF